MKRMIVVFLYILFYAVWGEESVAVVTSVSGQVTMVRAEDTVSYPAVMLDQLCAGDSLHIEQGAVTLLYQAGIIATYGEGSTVVIAPISDSTRLVEGNIRLSDEVRYSLTPLFEVGTGLEKVVPAYGVHEPEDSLIPVVTIFAPGNTSLSTARPDVIWSRYPDANWYSVVFQKNNRVVINNATTDTLMPFVELYEDLTPDSYVIHVYAFHDKDTLTSRQCVIRIIDSVEAETVKEKTAALENIQADDYTKNLLTALIFEDHSLLLRAAEYYTKLSTMRPQEPFAYKALAALYSELGLYERAHAYIEHYEELFSDQKPKTNY